MFKRSLLFLVAAGALAGCSTKRPPDTTSYVSPISGLRTDLLSENMFETPDKTLEVIELNGARVFGYNGASRFVLELDYLSSEEHGFLDIPPGETLTLVIDDSVVKLGGMGGSQSREKTKDRTVTERAFYTVDRPLFEKIAKAKKVRVEVAGNNGPPVVRWFAAVNFGRFADFVAKLDQPGRPAPSTQGWFPPGGR
jgi:hypothetical protein